MGPFPLQTNTPFVLGTWTGKNVSVSHQLSAFCHFGCLALVRALLTAALEVHNLLNPYVDSHREKDPGVKKMDK